MIKKIMGYNLFLAIKSRLAWIEFAIMNGITLWTFYSMVADIFQISSNNASMLLQLRVLFQTMGAVLPISILGFFLEFLLQEFLINEKGIGRFEFLMANGVLINDLWIGTALSIFILNSITLLSMYVITTIIMIIYTKAFLFNLYFLLLWFVIYPLLSLCLSFLLSALGFIIRRGKIMLSLIMAFTLLFFFVGTYFVRHIIPGTIEFNENIITPFLIWISLLIIVILIIAMLLLKRKITQENAILSIPD